MQIWIVIVVVAAVVVVVAVVVAKPNFKFIFFDPYFSRLDSSKIHFFQMGYYFLER